MKDARDAAMEAINAFMYEAIKHIEENGKTEESRVQAGVARRHSDLDKAVSKMLHYADPQRKIPIETVKAASAVMDKALDALTAFLNENPIPDKTEIKI